MRTTVAKTLIAGMILVLLVSVIGCQGNPMNADAAGASGGSDAYEYPITPLKTPDIWKTFTSHTQMLDATSIPEDVLSEMSTAGLVETCLNYPMFADMFAYNTAYWGMRAVESSFNGLQELYGRADAAKELVSVYTSLDLDALLGSSEYPYPEWTLVYLQFMVANERVVEKMTVDEKVRVMNKVLDNHETGKDNFSTMGDSDSVAHIIGRVLLCEDNDWVNIDHMRDALMPYLDGDIEHPYLTSEEYGELLNLAEAYVS